MHICSSSIPNHDVLFGDIETEREKKDALSVAAAGSKDLPG